ncbi:6073_t:CDS:1, partial [Gigaspora rosea]
SGSVLQVKLDLKVCGGSERGDIKAGLSKKKTIKLSKKCKKVESKILKGMFCVQDAIL